jgi:hypothetical protein
VESSDSSGYWIVDDDDFCVYGVWVDLAAKQKKIRKAGGVPATGAPMPKSVFDYE